MSTENRCYTESDAFFVLCNVREFARNYVSSQRWAVRWGGSVALDVCQMHVDENVSRSCNGCWNWSVFFMLQLKGWWIYQCEREKLWYILLCCWMLPHRKRFLTGYIFCPRSCPPVVYAVLRSWWRPIRRKQIPVYFTTWSCDWVVLPSCYVDEGRFVERDSWTVILCQAVVFQYISQPGVVNEFRLDRE